MIGTPSTDTVRTVTYVPGTFTGFNGYFTGGLQQISQYLAESLPNTVAFVYKDGIFPGETRNSVEPPDLTTVTEANSEDTAREAGQRLTQFGTGMRADPYLGDTTQIGIGHSWGLSNLTASEVTGTEYETVLSLSGAGMLPEWAAAPDTKYFDLSFDDILQRAQREGYVLGGNNPRHRREFKTLQHYQGPDDAVLQDDSIWSIPEKLDVLTENHNVIATDDLDNKEALEEMARLVE